jgi:hypothetical protein
LCDDMNALTALVLWADNTVACVLDELRAHTAR